MIELKSKTTILNIGSELIFSHKRDEKSLVTSTITLNYLKPNNHAEDNV